MNKILCIIPARGGSKRIPRKNALFLGDKPLVSYTIETAKLSSMFSDIVVSSDDDEILSIAKDLGVKGDRRPPCLTGDFVRAVEIVEEYLLRSINSSDDFQNVAMLLPTCPFRLPLDIIKATGEFVKNKQCDFLISVTEYEFPPQLAVFFSGDGQMLKMREPESYEFSTRSQSLEKYYHPNGAIYLARTDKILAKKTFFAYPMMGYIMPADRSFDIDYPYQFKIAEMIIKDRR